MSRTANDENSKEAGGWNKARNQLFQMIMDGRSFSGRERNCFFFNTGQKRFATISAASGLDYLDDARCIAITDWDGDGDEDLWVSNRTAPRIRLMRNNANKHHHFIAVRLVGNGRATSRDAVGARVEVMTKGPSQVTTRPLVKTLRAGEGFLSQSSKWLHFGLGKAAAIDRLTVQWPGGDVESFDDMAIDGRYVLTQGTGEAVRQAERAGLQLDPMAQSPQVDTRVARVALQSRIPMPSVIYSPPSGTETERFEAGTSTLVTLWASWCAPCVSELLDLATHAADLEQANVRVISLCVDRLGEHPSSDEDIGTLLNKIEYPHGWGHIDDTQLNGLQQLHNHLFFLRRPLPLPTSFLVDREGRLSVIYRGPVTTTQIITDVEIAAADYGESTERAACLPGRAINHPRVAEVAATGQKQARYLMALSLAQSGRVSDAQRHFHELIELAPTWGPPHRQLARLHLKQGSLQDAFEFARRALQFDPSDARAHNTIGLVYSEQKNTANALSHLRRAILADPEFAEAYNNLGTVKAGQGDIVNATKHFQKAVSIDDDFAEAHTNLGSAFAMQRQVAAAIQQFRHAIDVDPNYVDAHNNLGSMLGREGKFKEAIACFQRALSLDPGRSDTRNNLERAMVQLRAKRAAPDR